MKKVIALMPLLLLLGINLAYSEVEYQSSADLDAFISSDGYLYSDGPDQHALDVGYRNLGDIKEFRGAIRFNIPEWLSGENILGAELKLYYFDAWGSFEDRTVFVERITQAWNESSLWWFPASVSYEDSATVGGTDFRWIVWDVTEQVEDWIENSCDNYGFALIASPSGLNDNAFRFASRQHTNTEYRPILQITYGDSVNVNLRPTELSGWSDKILVSMSEGVYQDETIYAGETAYIHWAFENQGSEEAEPHMNEFYINDEFWTVFPSLGLPADSKSAFPNTPYIFEEAGTYSLKVIMDTEDEIFEFNETDNMYERTLNVTDGGQAPATYLDYFIGSGQDGDLITTEARVALSAHSTYYCALVWTGAAGPNGGYTGLQSIPEGDLIIFSVWDADSENPTNLEWRNASTSAVRYGNEGSGWSTKMQYQWQEDNIYRFYVVAYNRNGRTHYSQYMHDVSQDIWKHTAVLSYPFPGHWFRAVSSFLEDFAPVNGEDARHFDLLSGWKRKQSDGEWIEWDQASFNYSIALPPNENYHYDGDEVGDALRMESGGQTANDTPAGTILTRTMPPAPYCPGDGLLSLQIDGPAEMEEGEPELYTCTAEWVDESQTDVTALTTWFADSQGSFIGNELDPGESSPGDTITITAQADILSTSINAEKRVAVVSTTDMEEEMPPGLRVGYPHPNPFNPSTEINFLLAEPSSVTVSIYDNKGSLVRDLLDEYMPSGRNSVMWNGKNMKGEDVVSGVYYCRIEVSGRDFTRKLVLVR